MHAMLCCLNAWCGMQTRHHLGQACAWTVSKAKGLTRRGHACIPHSCVCSVVIMISRSDHHVIMDKNNLECYLEGPCACDAAGSPNG